MIKGIDLSKLPEWPKEAPSMLDYDDGLRVVDGKWVKLNSDLLSKIKKMGGGEKGRLDSIREEESEDSERAPQRYQPSAKLVKGRWVHAAGLAAGGADGT